MATYTFTCTHGVEFRDADDHVWAQFVLDEGQTHQVDGKTRYVYRFETDDLEIAQRLRDVDVDEYEITEIIYTH